MVNDTTSCSKSPSLGKASNRRLGDSLRQLEALHKGSGTDTHLRIPNGKRIKLFHDPPSDGTQPESRAMKKMPKFDMDFSVRNEDDGVTSGTCHIEISDSDEFPEPHELVRASVHSMGETDRGLASRASDYSDSDMDALIRDAQLGGITSSGIVTTKTQDISASRSIRRTLECKGRKEEDDAVTIATGTRDTQSMGILSPHLLPQVRMPRRCKFPL